MAGISVNQDSIREMLTCAICMEEFRSPRSLPCLHTFCQTCLGDYLVRKHVRPGTSFACPTCRETVVLPKQGVAGLRSNFLIESMLGLLETKTEVPEEDVFTGDLLSLDDFQDSAHETTVSSKEDYEKSKRQSPLPKSRRMVGNHLVLIRCWSILMTHIRFAFLHLCCCLKKCRE